MSSSKRKNPDENGDDENDDLLGLLEGDDFITEEENRQRQAEKRRLERKRRLQRLPGPDDNNNNKLSQPMSMDTETSSLPKIKQESPPDSSNLINQVPVEQSEPKKVKEENSNSEEEDEFDMFSSSVSPVDPSATNTKVAKNIAGNGEEGTQQDWDDSEGYYRTVIGEIISIDTSKPENNSHSQSASADADAEGIRLRVLGHIGKGVFSSVLKCSVTHNITSTPMPPVVAVKCIRHNETMAKAASSEIQVLQRLNNSPGIVPLLLPTSTTPLEHRGHVLLIFPLADHNLRDVLQKFGKGVGLSLGACRSYFGQLLAAATHLKKHFIIHSDLKPDNILVSANFSVVQLGDFGSALDVSSSSQSQQPTPYLVSRFYRAPEIILGLVPTFAIDLWSLAVTVAEIFLGDVLFKGKNNNDMIYSFMQHLGPFSNRLIRQHLVQCSKSPVPAHFTQRTDGAGSDYLFAQDTVDPVTGKAVNKYISLFSSANNSTDSNQHEVFPSTPLSKKLLKAKSAKDSRTLVLLFKDLLQKCLTLDPSRRVSLKDALQHGFFTKTLATKSNDEGTTA